jgi:hypothetical protein
MAADKEQCKNVGKAFVALLFGLRDGLDLEDAGNLQGLVSAGIAAIDDFKNDGDAATLYAISGAAEEFGDRRLDVEVPA